MPRLLSAKGIPELRKLARSGAIAKKLRWKGKGHEFSDCARLLNYYQTWLDDLYPRAKFADGLQIIEKVGHSKRMQVNRKQWIDEGKPGYARDKTFSKPDGAENEDDDLYASGEVPTKENVAQQDSEQGSRPHSSLFGNGIESGNMFFPDSHKTSNDAYNDDLPEDDELDALLAEQTTSNTKKPALEPESEGEDDLDALLAEQASTRASRRPALQNEESEDPDTLLAEQETRQKPTTSSMSRPITIEDDDDDDDDLDALLAEQETRQTLPLPPSVRPKANQETGADGEDSQENMLSSPLANEDEEDLDALLAEQATRQELALPRSHHSEDKNNKEGDTEDHREAMSSSPIPNEDHNDLDASMAAPKKRAGDPARQEAHDVEERTILSSPLMNPQEDRDDL